MPSDRLEEYFHAARANESVWVHQMGGKKRGPSYSDTVRKGVHAKIVARLRNTTYEMPAWRGSFEKPIPEASGTLTCLITPPKGKGRDAVREFNITLRDSLGTDVSTRLNLHIPIEKED